VVAEAQPEAVAAAEGGRAPTAAGARPEVAAEAPRQALETHDLPLPGAPTVRVLYRR
jgi:hypothetical protein